MLSKIPPHLPLPKGGTFPSLEKRGGGRFYDQCQFYFENIDNIRYNRLIGYEGRG
jgi:hypothetical protein